MRNPVRSLSLLLVAAVLSLWLALPVSAVTIDWVTVGDPGNAADDTGFGSVADVYRIGSTEVTNAQYVDFLNAVAETDPNGLYNTDMGTSGGISRSGGPGTFDYTAIAGREDHPVNFVSFVDALRFSNWLHNGQPMGPQGNATTEDGAYTITAQGIADNSISRNVGATVFLPSEDEWYKAAYYDALSMSYFDFPAGSDAPTACAVPSGVANTANCGNLNLGVTDVGSFTGSASPAGTFDQGGNLWEFTESSDGPLVIIRGGAFNSDPLDLAASESSFAGLSNEQVIAGFRVASIPEPGTGLLLMGGVLGLAGWRRRNV